ncbi:MAG: electron transfer flavoprotein subunit beta/FixA family protein [Chloroflexota bacterium]
MSVVVITKSTPDTAARVEVNAAGAVTWGDAQVVINPWDEYSVTEAVLLKEAHPVKTVALTVGPEIHAEALKQGLAIGIDEAVRVWDDGMEGQDSLGYSNAVTATINKLGDVDLIIFGKELVDVATDAHIFQVARKLGWPVLGAVSRIVTIDFAAKTITVERLIEEGKQTLSSTLPAVISVLKDINEPKYPSFIGIRKASKAIIPVWGSADLGIGDSGSASAALVKTTGYANLPVRQGSVEIIDGATDQEKADKLVAKLLEDKVL